MNYVTTEIGNCGTLVLVEPELQPGLTRRVFKWAADGSLEWAAYVDWKENNERARFYHFASRELPASMTA
jgi:hypothetical protein